MENLSVFAFRLAMQFCLQKGIYKLVGQIPKREVCTSVFMYRIKNIFKTAISRVLKKCRENFPSVSLAALLTYPRSSIVLF